jgi:predicted Zn-dependent protease
MTKNYQISSNNRFGNPLQERIDALAEYVEKSHFRYRYWSEFASGESKRPSLSHFTSNYGEVIKYHIAEDETKLSEYYDNLTFGPSIKEKLFTFQPENVSAINLEMERLNNFFSGDSLIFNDRLKFEKTDDISSAHTVIYGKSSSLFWVKDYDEGASSQHYRGNPVETRQMDITINYNIISKNKEEEDIYRYKNSKEVNYTISSSLWHEMGHVLGLKHPFDSDFSYKTIETMNKYPDLFYSEMLYISQEGGIEITSDYGGIADKTRFDFKIADKAVLDFCFMENREVSSQQFAEAYIILQYIGEHDLFNNEILLNQFFPNDRDKINDLINIIKPEGKSKEEIFYDIIECPEKYREAAYILEEYRANFQQVYESGKSLANIFAEFNIDNKINEQEYEILKDYINKTSVIENTSFCEIDSIIKNIVSDDLLTIKEQQIIDIIEARSSDFYSYTIKYGDGSKGNIYTHSLIDSKELSYEDVSLEQPENKGRNR